MLLRCVRYAALILALAAGGVSAAIVQERLGYPASARLLVIHADDFGMSHAVNRASSTSALWNLQELCFHHCRCRKNPLPVSRHYSCFSPLLLYPLRLPRHWNCRKATHFA